MYTYYVGDITTTATSNTAWTNSTSCNVGGCNCSSWTTGYCGCTGHTHYWWYPYPSETKYLYQIFCPKPGCSGKFWAEIDEIKACPKCKSKIKITDKESDYEVTVNK